jgi:acyl dehydratase
MTMAGSSSPTRERRTLSGAPRILPLYARAAAPMLPGASLLPFVPGRGKEIPELELELTGVRAKPADVAAYASVCGFALRDHLPPTYPHVLAFPLHLAVMADGSFPFGAVGLVHLENRIEQRRPVSIGEELALRVRPTQLQPHPKGQTFSLLTEALADEELVWQSESTMLRRGKSAPTTPTPTPTPTVEVAVPPAIREEIRPQEGGGFAVLAEDAPAAAEWRLGGDLGRRYAAVSGDRNPIHMHSLTAKPLGFPAAIAHGMWTKARCLAALESRLPDAFAVEIRFRKPILLPARVELANAVDGDRILFSVRDAKRRTPHLDGLVRPTEPEQSQQPQNRKEMR